MLIILLPSGLAFLLSVSLKRSLGRMNKHRGLLETHQRCFNEAKTKRYRTDAVLTTVLDCSLCGHEYQLWEETRLQPSSFCDHTMILSRYLQTSTPCRPAGSPSESVWQRAWTALRSARPTASTDINVTDCTENNSWYKNKGKFPPKPTTHIVPLTSRVIDPSRLLWCEFQSPGDRKDQTSFSFGAESVKKINVKT